MTAPCGPLAVLNWTSCTRCSHPIRSNFSTVWVRAGNCCAPSPFWLLVLDALDWQDRAVYEESRTWSMVEELPLRLAPEAQTDLLGGLLAISTDPHPLTTPFQTTVILAHDRRQSALQPRRRSREHALLRRLASTTAPGQFLIKRRRGAGKTEVAGLFLAPEAGLTDPTSYLPRVLASYSRPPAE